MTVPKSIDTDTLVSCLRSSNTVEEALQKLELERGIKLTVDSLGARLRRAGYTGGAAKYLALDPWWAMAKAPPHRPAGDWNVGDFEKYVVPDDFGKLEQVEIPVTWEEPPPADRTYVDKPTQDYSFSPLDCGSESERIFLIPDTHRPFHDKFAWASTLKAAREFKPHTVIFVGDWLDAYTVSSHDRDARRLHQLADEVKDANEGLDEIQDLKAERVIFNEGNHENRFTRYLLQHAPALLNITSIPQLLKFHERGWHFVPYKRHAKLGRLFTTHDCGYSGVNSIRSTANAFRHNVAFGHSHRLGISYYGTLVGERFFSANLGWLGDLDAADYAHESSKADWAHGFGTALMEKNGNVHMTVVPIVDRSVCVSGKIVQ